MPTYELDGVSPRIDPEAWLAPNATVIGNVEIGPRASVWFGAVVRGDAEKITIGEGSSVQDGAVVHCAAGLPTVIGKNVSLGHLACIEGCVVEDGSLVGTGAIMLQRSRLGAGSILAAGAVLGEGQEIPPGVMAAGVPAVVKKAISEGNAHWAGGAALHYQANQRRYRKGLRPEA